VLGTTWDYKFIGYRCRDCGRVSRKFAVLIKRDAATSIDAEVMSLLNVPDVIDTIPSLLAAIYSVGSTLGSQKRDVGFARSEEARNACPLRASDNRALSAEQTDQEQHHGDDQQDVNERTDSVGTYHAQQPRHEQDRR
jgi:hypothetical protein